MLEHLTDPIRFLHSIAETKQKAGISPCERFIISVPYMKTSRVGFWHIRENDNSVQQNAETVHIFELSPQDWQLLVKFAGYKIVNDSLYLQYPKNNLLFFTKYLWKKQDFEGFYIMELEIDNKWSSSYSSW